MSLFLHIVGTALLIAAGGGGGWAVCTYQKNTRQQLHTLSRLFRYMQELLSYQALSGEELLKRAGDYPEFAQIGVRSCCVLEKLPLPETLQGTVREEIQSSLRQLSMAPRTNACAILERAASLCGESAEQKHRELLEAKKLWPRLGGCLGALAAILLW